MLAVDCLGHRSRLDKCWQACCTVLMQGVPSEWPQAALIDLHIVQALGAVYQLNNLHFLVRGVQHSRELGGLGADWVEASSPLVRWPLAAERAANCLLRAQRASAAQQLWFMSSCAGDMHFRELGGLGSDWVEASFPLVRWPLHHCKLSH